MDIFMFKGKDTGAVLFIISKYSMDNGLFMLTCVSHTFVVMICSLSFCVDWINTNHLNQDMYVTYQ